VVVRYILPTFFVVVLRIVSVQWWWCIKIGSARMGYCPGLHIFEDFEGHKRHVVSLIEGADNDSKDITARNIRCLPFSIATIFCNVEQIFT
jgi:hypothetical protein